MNHNDIVTYGKTPILRKIFTSGRGYIMLPADVIDLKQYDNSVEEA